MYVCPEPSSPGSATTGDPGRDYVSLSAVTDLIAETAVAPARRPG
ncbi:hypothetical protein GCM10009736_32250 [Actinomadura bangladeshensis]